MLDKMPNMDDMTALVGPSLYDVWQKLCSAIDEQYDMDRIWNNGGKAWTYEYKYRRGGKTLCALYARENCVGFMVILGKDERAKFESGRSEYGAVGMNSGISNNPFIIWGRYKKKLFR